MSTVRARLGTVRTRLGTARARLGTVRARLGKMRARLGTVRTKLGKVRARHMVFLDLEKKSFEIFLMEKFPIFLFWNIPKDDLYSSTGIKTTRKKY